MNAKRGRRIFASSLPLLAVVGAALVFTSRGRALDFPEFTPGVAYANDIVQDAPLSIHIVRVDRTQSALELQSAHAQNLAIGLAKLGGQMKMLKPDLGVALAGVNGDFYERARAYAGDPRGLQIVNGEVLSAPLDTASFWVDAAGAPHTEKVASKFAITWSGGQTTPFGLNEDRTGSAAVLYTPAMGATTRTRTEGLELVLERAGDGPWLPLKIGETLQARVREIHHEANTPLTRETLVLSIGPVLVQKLPSAKVGDTLKISTASTPDVRGARTAVSGGPVLVHHGQKQDWIAGARVIGATGAYSVNSMSMQHPRSGLGWNDHYFYLVEVDGRQSFSRGMTLDELADYFLKLGCKEAMNLDGGGSATMWANGRLVNSPCDAVGERDIANSLLVVRKKASPAGGPSAANQTPASK